MKKRGQQSMEMPFGMIFSIILIVVFVVVAFIAVKHFLDIGETTKLGQFIKDFQDKVDSAWSGQTSEFEYTINLPGIQKICFANLSERITGNTEDYEAIPIHIDDGYNMFLIPYQKAQGFERNKIMHLDVSKITQSRNPYCVDISRPLKIKKGFYDKLVVVQ